MPNLGGRSTVGCDHKVSNMGNIELTGLFSWRNTVSLGYPCLESFLSIEPILDEALICVDPTSDEETLNLCRELSRKFKKVNLIEFEWPIGRVAGDGSAIGIASQFALRNVRTSHAINVQADEVYPLPLMVWLHDNWRQ